MKLAQAALSRPRSGVRKMMELAWGRPDVVHLEVGEPGFATPRHVVEAAHRAAGVDGMTRYAPTPGLPELRDALATKIRDFNGINASQSQVLVTNGGANALFVVLGSILEAGTSILIPNPGWSNFTMMTAAFGARPVYYDLTADGGYLPDLDRLAALVDPTTRAIILNSPSNPLGSVMRRDLLERLYEFAEKHDLWIISDECYDAVDFSGEFFSIGALEDAPERVVSVYSFSKVYAMTGWRVGYVAMPQQLVDPVLGLLQPSVMCVNTPAQFGALAAITGPQDEIDGWVKGYREHRDLVISRLAGSRYGTSTPEGGFYVWTDVSDYGKPSEEFAVSLLLDHGVATTPGTAFGSNGEGYLRLSLATPREQLEIGLSRMLAV